jgi:hypothetical protein
MLAAIKSQQIKAKEMGPKFLALFSSLAVISPAVSAAPQCERYSPTVTACVEYPFVEARDSSDGTTLTFECGKGASWNGWSEFFVRKLYRGTCGSSLDYSR